MAIRYRNRERRLDRITSRLEMARRGIADLTQAAAAHDAWWRRHGGTLDAWRHAIAERQRRQPATTAAAAANRFTRWTSLLRWHPAVLLLRLECWWLTRKLASRGIDRGSDA
jgi:hypothetical protein